MRNVDRDATSTSATAAEAPTSELRGSVLDVARALRDENDWDAILEIVGKLVAENADMSRRLARIASRFKTSEKIGRAQLVLFVDALQRGEGEPETDAAEPDGPDELDEADAKLRAASGIDDNKDGDLGKLTTRPPRQPANRTAAPAHLRRLDNPILVPPAQRACPRCGTERSGRSRYFTKPLAFSQAAATSLMSFLSTATCLYRSARVGVSILADTASRSFWNAALSTLAR